MQVTDNSTAYPSMAFFDANLNRVWHKWGAPCGSLSGERSLPCNSGEHGLEWPLQEGKTWETFEGGDVREGAVAKVTRANQGPPGGAPSFVVTFPDNASTGPYGRVMILSPEVGWSTLDTWYGDDGRPARMSVLVEYHHA